MKKITYMLIAVFCLSFFGFEADAQMDIKKRRYTKGYQIDIFSKKKRTVKVKNNQVKKEITETATINQIEPIITDDVLDLNLTASTEDMIVNPVLLPNKEVFDGTEAKTYKVNNKELRIALKDLKRTAADDFGPKNKWVAVALWFFLGTLSLHRFYLGKTGTAIIQLLMFIIGIVTLVIVVGLAILAAWYIWLMIDIVRILIGGNSLME